ncbi:PDZ domain-containing protein [Oceanirhabdus sp. W0125-5]|uniref:PDZ domain-containing protein n=1 Tax=Oceanirhabdus sp. W0125-5 TaxID=2999116 RepID=UPI0022F34444|nr:PDZ domain-containing protein [Oceanirhabdus sp. W0125-5]WBW99285.1 PDZ domain-containing protein [Oceanirhabdus sp. W0125-5]
MDIVVYSLKAISYTITNPAFLVILFVLGLVLYSKNKKSRMIEKMILGSERHSALELTLSQIVLGILGGIGASIISTSLGITFKDGSAIILMFLISVILMMLKPRFICFSYSGAILGILSLMNILISEFFLVNKIDILDINIVSLIALIGVLHIIEGFIVALDGQKGALPVFTKRENETIGGFALNRYYTIPMVLMVFMVKEQYYFGKEIAIGNWWPILKGTLSNIQLESLMLSMIPVVAIIGYNSVTFTKSKRGKSFFSGSLIFVFGFVLVGISQLIIDSYFLQLIAVIIMPVLHELMIKFERYKEKNDKPRYFNEKEGIRVLEVGKNTLADKIGVKSGDILLSVNGDIIEDEISFPKLLKECGSKIVLKLKRNDEKILEVVYEKISKSERFGIIFVPKKEYQSVSKTKFKDIIKNVIEDKNENSR